MSLPLETPPSHRTLVLEDAELRRWVRAFAPARVDPADVTQDAWLAALERDLAPGEEPLGGWLRVAARRIALRRGWREGRRAAVESSVARPVPGDRDAAAAELDREAARQLLERLDEPYRAVLRARFLEDLSIDEIARRLGRPPATIRSQLHRGLERLRARLSPEQRRERRLAWLGLLRRPRVALGGVALGALGVLAFQLSSSRGVRPDGTRGGLVEQTPATSAPIATRIAERAPLAIAVPPASAPTVPVLEVLVRDASGAPGAGATVLVTTADGLAPRASTDAEGRASVPLRPTDLGAYGLPATAGRVTLRARRAGSADSRDLHVDPGGTGAVELELGGPALALGGHVVDPDGQPVAGALVACLQGPAFVAPSTPGPFETPPRFTTETDAEGRFALAGLERRPALVRVWTPGLAEHRESIAPGHAGRLDLELALPRGATVVGTLLDREGRPLAGAEVFAEPDARLTEWGLDARAFDLERLDLLRATHSAADGTFRLAGLEPGPRTIWARQGDDAARLRVHLAAGETREWNPDWLPREGLVLRIRDAPARARVRLSSGPPEAQWIRVLTPDAGGLVRVHDLPEGAVYAEVLDASLMQLLTRAGPLAPGPEVHELTVAADPAAVGLVRGVLLDARGAPAPQAELKRYDPWSHSQVAIAIDPATGAFEAHFPPGTFVLGCVVERRGLPLGTYELAPAQVLDLGRILLPSTGRLVPLLGAGPAVEGTPATFRLSARYGTALFRELLRGPWPPPESFELFPGPHWIEVMDPEGNVLLRASAEVRAGEETWIDLL